MTERILHIIGRMNVGGAETFIMNVYRNIDREKVQFDFVVHTKEKCDYEDEIKALGGKIYRIEQLSKHPLKSMKQLRKIIIDNKDVYRTIHRHTDSAIVFTDLLIAKLAGIKNRYVHSHSDKTSKGSKIHRICRPILNILATRKFACGQQAGEWLFGKKQNFEIIQNGIDIEKYKFNKNIRDEVRKELNLKENDILIGHVGRFHRVKNHDFLIDIFYEVQKEINAKLVLVGTGELQDQIKEKVRKLGISDKVIFLGLRQDVNRIMQAMDIFLFPSLFEGLPLTLIEAQAAGLKILASDTITKKCNITGDITFISLEEDKDIWKRKILEILEHNERNIDVSELYKEGFDSKQTAKKLQNIYLNE